MTSRKPTGHKNPQRMSAWIRRKTTDALELTRRFVPPGLRLVLGLLLIAGGTLGFLPVLGFWMIPLGVAVAALDIKPLGRTLMALLARRK